MRTFKRYRSRALVESLENRRLMSGIFPLIQLNTELLNNGDAEEGFAAADNTSVFSPSEWDASPTLTHFTAVAYGATGGLPDANTPGPADKGKSFFAGGPGTADSLVSQTIDVQAVAAGIDAGVIKANLSAWLGGWAAENDHINVTAQFLGPADGDVRGAVALTPVLAADRNNTTSFLKRLRSVTIPAGTRRIEIDLEAIKTDGTYNDGYADDISLKLSSTAKTGYITGNVFNDIDGDGMHAMDEKAARNITAFVDKNGNDELDKGEISAKTNKFGDYTLANVPKGDATVRLVLPAGYRTTIAPVGGSVAGGATTFLGTYGITQYAAIEGEIFNDVNANGSFDAKEKGLTNLYVYLDFNNNGQLDPFEIKTTGSGPFGAYSFAVPFGNYTVRIQAPKGYKATNNLNGRQITVGKGQEVSGVDYGVRKV